jgi:putative oxidoreductase
MEKKTHVGVLIVRVAIGLPMLIYGISKVINGIDFISQLLIEKGLPPILSYGVYVGEVVAPVMLILGFRARIAAFLFAFNCLTALLLTQTSSILKLNDYGGWAVELLAIYMLVAASLVFTGSGKFSLSTVSRWD